ncbi:MAG: hypothetical protein PHQ46_02185 [Negativicutes bacterium]|nr:hypothetical protein [Negativicutes bacterium]
MIGSKKLEDDPYQDIYDEVEVNIDSVDKEDLFAYCLEICKKIFSVAEVDFGKEPLNLPKGFLDEIGIHLLEFRRTKIISPEDSLRRIKYTFWSRACDKYGADEQYNAKQKRISLGNLKNLLKDVLPEENNLPEINRRIRHICTYLPSFFGLKYNKNDSAELRFEKLRLILILYSFKENMGFDLGYLMKRVSLKTTYLSPEYRKGVSYVKEMVGHRLSFADIMHLEHWVSTEYNCIRLLDKELISSTLRQMDFVNCARSRMVMKKLYVLLCERLTSANHRKHALQAEVPVEVDAYIHFAEQAIFGDFSISSVKQMRWMNIEPDIYEVVAAIKKKSKQDEIFVDIDAIREFIGRNKYEIANLITNNKAEHKDRVRILHRNSIRDYLMMVRIYQFGFHIKEEERLIIQTDTLLWLIFLYEGCKRNTIDFSLVDRIAKSARKKNVHSILSSLIDNERDEQFLTENWKYVKIINWLVHKMFMIQTYRTPYIVALERRAQKKIRRFWRNNIPILDNGKSSCKYQCIEEISKELLNRSDIQNIVYEIENNRS